MRPRIRVARSSRTGVLIIAVVAFPAGCGTNTAASDPSPAQIYRHPDGWTVAYPALWRLQEFERSCRLHERGVIVSNTRHAFRTASVPPNHSCSSNWSFDGVPSEVVVVEFAGESGGPADDDEEDTRLPLSLADAVRQRAPPGFEHGAPQPFYFLTVYANGMRFRMRVWIGPDASKTEKAHARRIVRSVRFARP